MRISKYVVRWKKMTKRTKQIAVLIGIVGVTGVGFLGYKAYPHVETFFIRKNFEYHSTKAERDEMDKAMKEMETPRTKQERMELYEATKFIRDAVAVLKPETDIDKQFFQEYLQQSEDLKTNEDGKLYYQYKQNTKQLYEMLYPEIQGLQNNFDAIQKEYELLQKQFKDTKEWKDFVIVYQQAKAFLESQSFNVDEKEQIENNLLEAYMELQKE